MAGRQEFNHSDSTCAGKRFQAVSTPVARRIASRMDVRRNGHVVTWTVGGGENDLMPGHGCIDTSR